jgi:outer membrane protein assembly factor BamD (BamD/ComL family)
MTMTGFPKKPFCGMLKTMKTQTIFGIFLLVFLSGVFSCASGPVDAPEGLPAAKIIQRAQEAADVNKYKLALRYYEILLDRYGYDDEYIAVGEYEIAFIYYKQKKYSVARQGFSDLLERYKQPGNRLPRQFKTLSEKMLARLTEIGH